MLGHRYNQEFYMKVELTFEETKAFQKSATNASAKKKARASMRKLMSLQGNQTE